MCSYLTILKTSKHLKNKNKKKDKIIFQTQRLYKCQHEDAIMSASSSCCLELSISIARGLFKLSLIVNLLQLNLCLTFFWIFCIPEDLL